MMDISNAVKEGVSAFLKREMKIIVPVSIALAVIIGAFYNLQMALHLQLVLHYLQLLVLFH